ncbi:hypothetical protein [Hazenella coriacea]|uniref:Uncharacterized protein n=1 Tax=Hazenella coriacea TaxID=1179467 RepID=A0A4R3L2N0_9BACL|nr:hypothetical protein [Hazenella coriacea]TCS93155.1 hypothetical protein EDD58_10997 [Hazenella coriacea]
MNIQFQTPHQYLFIHQNVKHLLLLWKKERKRDLYLVEEENDQYNLSYPGETYVETVLEQIEPILLQHLETEEETFTAILGATFHYQDKLIALYYHPTFPDEQLYFFEIQGETLIDLSDEEFPLVLHTFATEFPEYFSSKA